MTEIFGLFDAADPEDPDRVYSAAVLMSVWAKFLRDGVVHDDGDELAVAATTPAAMSVDVGTGAAIVQGRYYINDEALTLDVEAADPSYPRIDRAVLRLDATPGRTIHAIVKQGTPATSPTAPTLTRTSEIWEISLAQIAVGAGATSIVAGNITDERTNATLCGVAAPVYVPSSQLEITGPVDMQGKALSGLPVPSAATDAARRNMGGATLQGLGTPSASTDAATKGYIDTPTVDRSMNGKKITSLGTPTVATDAVTKAYSDGLLAALKLSQITIDSDLDMGTHAIKVNTITERTAGSGVNVDGTRIKDNAINGLLISGGFVDHHIKAFYMTVAQSDNVIKNTGDGTEVSGTSYQTSRQLVMHSGLSGTANEVRLKFVNYHTVNDFQGRVLVNESQVWESATLSGFITHTVNLTGIKAGDVIKIQTRSTGGGNSKAQAVTLHGTVSHIIEELTPSPDPTVVI